MIFSRLENIELEKRTSLSVGSSDFISLNPLKIDFYFSSVSDVLMKKIHLNLPTHISFGNNSSIEYIYNAAGQKVKKRVYDGTVSPNTIKDVHYLDGFQYAGDVLQFFPHAEGYVDVTANEGIGGLNYLYNYVFNYTDHLGNIRMSFTKDPVNNQLKILEENHYYPFGLKHEVYADAKQMYQLVENLENTARPTFVYKTDYQYKYQGQELQDELGLNWYSYKYRNYDSATARFFNVDPLAEGYHWQSVYVFGSNQPVHAKEIEGLESADDKSLMNRAMNWAGDYAAGAWSTAGAVVQGAATSTYTGITNGITETGKVIDAYNEGGVGAAVEQYGQSVYETSGAKGIVDIGSRALSGDAHAQGSAVVLATAVIFGNKAGGKGSTAVSESTSSKASVLGANRQKGAAFESKVGAELKASGAQVAEQVTIKAGDGTKTRVDFMTKDGQGNVNCIECKSSATAPLTPNQSKAFPQIQATGGTVVGQKGNSIGLPNGTQIPPTKVEIKRP